jgi:prepilin-type N-terminal cleavage/methylation domain-containing protein
MTEGLDMKFKAFTLIELMVVLAIIVIIATASVPQVQVWIARNRGNQAVSQIISDFSKAKSIAAYTVNDSIVSIDGNTVAMGVRPETAIVFRNTFYTILQKADLSAAWDESANDLVKRVQLPLNVHLEDVNGGVASDTLASTSKVVFTSTGRVKNGSTNLIVSDLGYTHSCKGAGSPINGRMVFTATLKSVIDPPNALWYQIDIAESGEYAVCVSASATGDTPPVFASNAEGYLDI